jgi:hypothetical protein
MTEAKPTPGPWATREMPAYDLDVIEVFGQGIGVRVASVDGEDLDALEANAALISAAPDLLAALEAILAKLEHYDLYLREVKQARTAIAKARGEVA